MVFLTFLLCVTVDGVHIISKTISQLARLDVQISPEETAGVGRIL